MPSKFRPCIDIHSGKVKQIVGGSLTLDNSDLQINYESEYPAEYYARLYKEHELYGAHVIMLNSGCEIAAERALKEWPGMLQLGGGINSSNAKYWIDKGAGKVIVTSFLFPRAIFQKERLVEVAEKVGKERVVVDLSCRKEGNKWIVAMNKWQTPTNMELNEECLKMLEDYCSEFLVHAADKEGLCQGIDYSLVEALGKWSNIPVTYAGGANDIRDLKLVDDLSNGKVDLTFGSALDIFGGRQVSFIDCVKWNRNTK